MKLPSPVEFTIFIKPITLPCSSSPNIGGGLNVIAIGNGARAYNDYKIGLKLQYVELQTIEMQTCLETLELIKPGKNLFCAKDVLGEHSICFGDSGGPLIKNDTGELIGIINGPSDTKCQSKHPQVFIPVSAYMDWIQAAVTGIICEEDIFKF